MWRGRSYLSVHRIMYIVPSVRPWSPFRISFRIARIRTKDNSGQCIRTPFQTKVSTYIMTFTSGSIFAGTIWRLLSKECFRRCLPTSIVIRVTILHITPYLNLLRIFGKVNSQRTCCSNTRTGITSAQPRTGITKFRKSFVIRIIGRTDDRDTCIIFEPADHYSGFITFFATITGYKVSNPAFFHSFFYGKVKHSFLFPIINSGNTCHITLLVISFHLFDHISG